MESSVFPHSIAVVVLEEQAVVEAEHVLHVVVAHQLHVRGRMQPQLGDSTRRRRRCQMIKRSVLLVSVQASVPQPRRPMQNLRVGDRP